MQIPGGSSRWHSRAVLKVALGAAPTSSPHPGGPQDWCRRSSAKLRVPGRSLPCCWVRVLPKVGASGQPPRSRRMGLGGAQHPSRRGFGKSPASHCSQETCRDMTGNRRGIWVKIGSPHTKTWHTYLECPVREDPGTPDTGGQQTGGGG